MSCISSNFSSFFLDSLNDPSEFAKYLSNGENNKFSSPFEEFQVFSSAGVTGYSGNNGQQHHHHQQQQQQQYCLQQQQNFNGSNGYYNNNLQVNSNGSNNSGVIGTAVAGVSSAGGQNHNNANQQHTHPPTSQQQQQQQYVGHPPTSSFQQSNHQLPLPTHHPHTQQHPHPHQPTHHQTANPVQGYASPTQRWSCTNTHQTGTTTAAAANQLASTAGAHFDGSFEFLKYLRHSNDYSNGTSSSSNSADDVAATTTATATGTQSAPSAASLIDLDTSTSMKPRSARKAAALLSSATRAVAALDNTLDVFDHDDSKHTIFDLQHNIANNSNSNEESSMDISNLAFPHSLLNASNSNTSSESAVGGNADFTNLTNAANASNAPKPLATFTIKENFEVHPSHKVEEGIFQHMNKLPPKKKETLKQLGVRFTGQMTLADKSIVVDNFIKFCQEYEITDHRPYLSLNQSGLNKPEQIKFARYLGQGLPSFTLFCIYSNFKNLFCTKRIENYTKDGYNLPYILDKTKRFLSNTTADLKNISQQQSNDGLEFSFSNNNNNNNQNQSIVNVELMKNYSPKILENFLIYENFEVHDTHRIEDGICTHITRLPPKKQEILKQFGIQSNQSVTYYEKYIIVENFIKFCNEYKISDHRPFLDFQESGLSKAEQIKFVRYLGQGLPNLTLNKIFVAFRDVFGMNRIEKITMEGYNLDAILKKKKKNLYNRMHAAVHLRENVETTPFAQFPQHDADDPFDLTKSKS